jgi:ribosomal protein S4
MHLASSGGIRRDMQPKEIFDLAPFYEMECKPSALLVAIGATPSHSEAKRLIKQGAVQVNKQIISNNPLSLHNGDMVKVGKLFYRKVKMPSLKAEYHEFDKREDEEQFLRESGQFTEAQIQTYLREDFG